MLLVYPKNICSMLAGLDACIRITTDQLTPHTTECRCQSAQVMTVQTHVGSTA